MMLAAIWGVWALINGAVFILYGVDKRRARRGAWRIPERTLLLGAWLLGGVGAWTAMRVFRHKTKHLAFQVSVPIAAVLSAALMLAVSAKLLHIF